MQKPLYKRVLLKISGEALAGEKTGLDFKVIESVCETVKQCVDMGVQIGIVVGGGISGAASRTAAVIWTGHAPTIWECSRRR